MTWKTCLSWTNSFPTLNMNNLLLSVERLWLVKSSALLITLKTCVCAWLHWSSYCPCSSICTDLLILPSSLPSSPFPQVPPVVQSITGISTSYLLHSAVVTSHSVYHTTTPLCVVQSRPFTKHARAMMAGLYIPHSICSWHSCITFSLLTPFPKCLCPFSSLLRCFTPLFGNFTFCFSLILL